MANRISDKSALTTGLVWVLLRYPDDTEFCFQTTLNGEILSQLGIVLEEGKLVRLDKKYFVRGDFVYKQFPYVGVSVSLWDSEHYTDPTSASLRDFM